ncbi:MAG TPA: GNAT family N-acetyltransferase [Candidatus Polarisedimenticolaceae bacterium]|nr:GNAT family N-acetyltransferase [Candidatus Polarisedimenticolaceae bacterium]
MEQTSETAVTVRGLKPGDLDAVIALDARNVGRRREAFFRIKLQQNLQETGIKVSLAAEVDGIFTGFLLARVYYGEFGTPEPVAVLDTIDVHPDFRGRGVGTALMRQLQVNLHALGVGTLRTEVGWDEQGLLRFFHHTGFRPAPRFCLDLILHPLP